MAEMHRAGYGEEIRGFHTLWERVTLPKSPRVPHVVLSESCPLGFLQRLPDIDMID